MKLTTGRSQIHLRAEHLFTPEEANRALPTVKEIVSSIIEIKNSLEYTTGKQRREDLDRLSLLMSRLEATGAELKDLDLGLIDFPAMRFNEPVYLCWKPGETSVLYWHGISEGFRGRKLLKPEQEQIP